MRVRNNIGIGLTGARARRHPVPEASVVTKTRAVVNAEWRPGLPTGNAGQLPAPEQAIPQPRPFEKRQIVYVADAK